MTDEDIRARLLGERERLDETRQAVLSGGDVQEGEAASLGELSTVDQHPAEMGTETFTVERDQSVLEQVASELDDVEAALRRLDEGTYGRCEICSRPIGDARLEAVPATRFCLEHQQMAEKE